MSIWGGGGPGVGQSGNSIIQNIVPIGNVTPGENNLLVLSLPAEALAANGDAVEIEAWGTFAASVNLKQVKLYFGAMLLFATGAVIANGSAWFIKGRVIRISATAQNAVARFEGNLSLVTQTAAFTTPTETLSGSVAIKCTGEGAGPNDIVQHGLRISWPSTN